MPALADDASSSVSPRLLIVSNRLPVVVRRDHRGNWTTEPGSGGLVTAITPILRERGGLWIGNPGTAHDDGAPVESLLAEVAPQNPYQYEPVLLSREQLQNYYLGFANQIIWPLFHNHPSRCLFAPAYWETYQEVNDLFADVVLRHLRAGDFVWVHDYHLMRVGAAIRRSGSRAPLGFFLHIPFPPPDIFSMLPWRFEVLDGLLEYDLLGFQTGRDLRHFLNCVDALADEVEVDSTSCCALLRKGQRRMRAAAFPISIDFDEFADVAASPDVARGAAMIRQHFDDVTLVMSADRLDYTKGLLAKLQAFRTALDRFPELRGRMTLVQIVVPSRTQIPEYNRLRRRIEQTVGEINGLYSEAGWVPVHYLFRSLPREELISFYRAADIALVTPLKDGMNLVAKEYCASSPGGRGVLILSEFAGAAGQLHRDALVVHPNDSHEVADALHRAFKMPMAERRSRMQRLRESVRREDIYWWVDAFMNAVDGRRAVSFPSVEDYTPRPRPVPVSVPDA